MFMLTKHLCLNCFDRSISNSFYYNQFYRNSFIPILNAKSVDLDAVSDQG